jgi:glycosyltransferase
MKISIITATYNSYPEISEAIKSIRNLSDIDLEYLVIDGGSKDQTLDIINASGIVTQCLSEPDKGIYDALNKGIMLATGDIIGFLHSDDLFASADTLRNIVEAFNPENSDDEKRIDGVYGDLVYVKKENTDKIIRYWESNKFQQSLLQWGWMPAHPSLFLRREVYEKHGLFDLNFKIAADYDLMLRIFKDKSLNFAYLPEVITKMRAGGMSNGTLKNIIRKTLEDFRALKKNNISFPLITLILKNTSKLRQFWIRTKY